MERFAADLIQNLYGNAHSASPSSQAATERIEHTRLQVLDFFKADASKFDVVFVANATAGVKLVMDSFRSGNGFVYGYHKDSHNSIIGVREVAAVSRCLDDETIERSIRDGEILFPARTEDEIQLYAYPAQSNFNGRRLPLTWCRGIRGGVQSHPYRYVLLDAAALVSTSQLDLSNAGEAPDFTVVSFNKIFGFPDLGALLVRKSRGDILRRRKYFGGGTVEMVVATETEQWHIPKGEILHESLEDGTLPIHNIIALDTAMKVHKQLFESMDRISEHTAYLAGRLYSGLKALKHANGADVCRMYSPQDGENYGNEKLQGPVVPFNIANSQGAWMSNAEVQRVASVRKIHIRTGGMCNPGGVARACNLAPWELSRNFLAGARCGGDYDIAAGKPMGVIRASFGAMSSISDVEQFIAFVHEFYAEKYAPAATRSIGPAAQGAAHRVVQSLTVYPIKSCGGYEIPASIEWDVNPEGLAWDREWCFINQSNGQVMSQKKYPKMALVRPELRVEEGVMAVWYKDTRINVPLSSAPKFYESSWSTPSKVCDDRVTTWRLKNFDDGNTFFSDVLGVPCALARFPSGGSGPAVRHSKAHLQKHQGPQDASSTIPVDVNGDTGMLTPPRFDDGKSLRPILLSNESPILLIIQSSVDAINAEIARGFGKPADARVFRANIVVGSSLAAACDAPYDEDNWSSIQIGQQNFTMLGSCRRCHMICIDQETAEKNAEPFLTLAKTRKMDGKVWFGSHMCHNPKEDMTREGQRPTISVGDQVVVTGRIGE